MESYKNRKIVFAWLLLLFIFISLYFYIGGFPITFNNRSQVLNFTKLKNECFNPLENVDFNDENNTVLLLFAFEDIDELPEGIPKRKVLVCYDNEILRNLKNNFMFIIKDGDMATVTSEIIVLKNDKIILKTNFVLSKNLIGIQSEKTGLAEATNTRTLHELFSRFRPYRKLFLKV